MSGRLADILAPDLRCVFVGINPGLKSAEAGFHFANPRNDFWRLLADAGLTSRLLEPSQQDELLANGLGLTNAARRVTRGSGELRRTDFADAARRLGAVARDLHPGAFAFVGKQAYAGAFGERPDHGLQARELEGRPLFVLPSTSPANAAVPYPEKLRWFRELAKLLDRPRADGSKLNPETERETRSAGEMAELWGGETRKAVDNFPVSGETIPVAVVHWLGRIKGAAARVNASLALLDEGLAERIAAAADEIAAGEHDDQFPIDVFQTGSGTSSNMNANEVIATLAGEGVHANDHVNMGQSSNDVFPSAVHLAALDRTTHELLPAVAQLGDSLARKAEQFADVAKAGRTHLMDAVPVTLGQEFGGYAAQVREGQARIEATLERLGKIPLGGTAVGTGLNTHPRFAAEVRKRLSADTGLEILPPADPFEAQANRDGLVEASAALKGLAVSLTKIANDLRWMGSGPRAGLAEIFIPELQKGSSIMPGKVNPVIPEVVCQVSAQVIGNDTAITVGGLQGSFELNVQIPLMARNLLQSIALLSSTCRLFAEKCVDGIEANREVCERHGEASLAMATALNPYIGYDRATAIVKDAAASGRTLREVALEHGVDAETLDKALDLRAMARGSSEG